MNALTSPAHFVDAMRRHGVGWALVAVALAASGGGLIAEGPRQQRAPRLERVAALPTEPSVYFGSAADADVLPDGRIAVLDGQARAIYVFRIGGTAVDTIGREGAGPGEIRLAANLVVGPGGEIAVPDVGNARVTIWGPNGGFRRQLRLTPGWVGGIEWTDNGMLVKSGRFTGDSLDFFYASVGGDSLTSLLRFPASDATSERTCVFCAWSVFGNGDVIVAAPDTLYLLTRIAMSGRIVSTYIRRGVPAVRRTAQERDDLRRRYRRRAAVEGATPTDPPAFKPRFVAIGVDGTNRVWAQRTPGEGEASAIDVFAEDGNWSGEVALDPGFTVVALRGSLLLAVGLSPEDEPMVAVFRIVN